MSTLPLCFIVPLLFYFFGCVCVCAPETEMRRERVYVCMCACGKKSLTCSLSIFFIPVSVVEKKTTREQRKEERVCVRVCKEKIRCVNT